MFVLFLKQWTCSKLKRDIGRNVVIVSARSSLLFAESIVLSALIQDILENERKYALDPISLLVVH